MPLTLKLLSKSRNYANTKGENYSNNSMPGFQRTLNAHMDLAGYVVAESKTLRRSTIRHQKINLQVTVKYVHQGTKTRH